MNVIFFILDKKNSWCLKYNQMKKKNPFYLILSYYKSDTFNIYLNFLDKISEAVINFKTTVSQSKWDT